MKYKDDRLIPREYGAWSILLLSWLAGLAWGNSLSLGAVGILLVMSSLLAFREILRSAISHRYIPGRAVLIYILLLTLGGYCISTNPNYHRLFNVIVPLTIALLAIELVFIVRRKSRDIISILVGTAFLTLSAPAVYQLTQGDMSKAWLLFTLLLLHFIGIALVAFSKIRLASWAKATAMILSVVGVAFSAYLYSLNILSLFIILAFIIFILQVVLTIRMKITPSDIKRLGWSQVAGSTIFTTLVIYANLK